MQMQKCVLNWLSFLKLEPWANNMVAAHFVKIFGLEIQFFELIVKNKKRFV